MSFHPSKRLCPEHICQVKASVAQLQSVRADHQQPGSLSHQPVRHSHVVTTYVSTEVTSSVGLEQCSVALQASVTATTAGASSPTVRTTHSFPAGQDCLGLMVGKLACRPLAATGTGVRANYSCTMSVRDPTQAEIPPS